MAKQDESYLDDLLNSVITSGPTSVTSVTREEIRLRAEKKRLEKTKKEQKIEEQVEAEEPLASDVVAEPVPEIEILTESVSVQAEDNQESAFEVEGDSYPFSSTSVEEPIAEFVPDLLDETLTLDEKVILEDVLPDESTIPAAQEEKFSEEGFLLEQESNTVKAKEKKKKSTKKDSFKDAVKKLKKTVNKEPKNTGKKEAKRGAKKEVKNKDKKEKILEIEESFSIPTENHSLHETAEASMDFNSLDFTDPSEDAFPNEEFKMERSDNILSYFDSDEQDTDIPQDYNIFDDDDSFLDKMLEADSHAADTDSFFESALDEDLLKSLEDSESNSESETADNMNMFLSEEASQENSSSEEITEPVEDLLFTGMAKEESADLPELDAGMQDMLGDLFSDLESEGDAKPEKNVEDEDYMQLFDSILSDESEIESSEEEKTGSNQAEDEILSMSDFMSGVDSSEDSALNTQKMLSDDDLMDLIPDDDNQQGNDASGKQGKKEKQKKSIGGIFKKLFSNIPSDLTEEQLAKMKEKVVSDYNAKEEQAKIKAEKAKSEEELKKQKAEEAAVKKAEQEKIKEEKKKKAAEAKAAKKDEKLKKQQEIQNLIDEVEASNVGKINKTGAGIVFLMFISMAIFVIIGTNVYTYKRSMEDAANYFGRKFYNEAFYEVYGLEPKDEDIELYDKILTVMFVKKQLNSYENYYALEMYPQALNSLLKGIKLYDKYYGLASTLEISTDFEYIKASILDELNQVFHISEEEAERLIAIEDRVVYSDEVYQYANKLQQQLAKDGMSEKSK